MSDPHVVFVPIQFESHGGECKAFYEYLKEHRDGIILDYEPLYASRSEIAQELDLVLEFIEFDLKAEKVQWNSEAIDVTCFNSKPSVFECILGIYSHLTRPGLVTCYFIREQEEAVTAILGRFKKLNQAKITVLPSFKASYSSLVITENADLHSAVDLLSSAWNNIFVPWAIRDVLVQEAVASKFEELLYERLATIDPVQIKSPYIKQLIGENLKAINDKNLKLKSLNGAHVVRGIQRDHLKDIYICVPIITLNVFRTVKEAASLYNKVNGGSASIWSENISEAFELAQTLKAKQIWVNCNGLLNPSCTYEFGDRAYYPELLSHSAYLQSSVEFSSLPDSTDLSTVDPALSFSRSFFDKNVLFNVVAEDNLSYKETFNQLSKVAGILCKNPDLLKKQYAKSFLKIYKTVVIRFGQTFAN